MSTRKGSRAWRYWRRRSSGWALRVGPYHTSVHDAALATPERLLAEAGRVGAKWWVPDAALDELFEVYWSLHPNEGDGSRPRGDSGTESR
jgi:hypothetical protein